MDFVFIFCIPWIVLSSVGCRNFLKYLCLVLCVVLFTCSVSAASTEDPEALKDNFLIKSSKVIEAAPNSLRRQTTVLPDGCYCEERSLSENVSTSTHIPSLTDIR
ncbi:hypothetical protein CEXT_259461 [Caerostris extrusa]|uniref:Uncharacterized protein n=1 Tax=Caerostris extrusa TaxID=172846 RepID=A0AAV4WGT2_CAEEX|nr:hypothetical protein CEXT_259461 [Caerostris extrusa]